MKKSGFLLSLAFSFFSIFSAQAKIWRVNNNPGITVDFTTLQAAHDGASSGDTIHLEGSPNSYGGLQCSKKLVILGPGYFLGENQNTQALTQSGKADQIVLNDGSEGSVIMGLDFRNNSIYVRDHNIVVRRNNFASSGNNIPDWGTGSIQIQYADNNGNIGASDIIISQNYGVQVYADRSSTGILITNNYIGAPGHTGAESNSITLQLNDKATAIVQNNIFVRGRVIAYNSSFTNNIMVAGTYEGADNLTSNNLANGEQFGIANGNKANVNMSAVFVGAGTDISSDGQWKLAANSPAIGAGYGSTTQKPIDAGMYGGYTPYVLSGQPPVPAIYFFENQPVGSNSDPIKVSVKVKSVGN